MQPHLLLALSLCRPRRVFRELLRFLLLQVTAKGCAHRLLHNLRFPGGLGLLWNLLLRLSLHPLFLSRTTSMSTSDLVGKLHSHNRLPCSFLSTAGRRGTHATGAVERRQKLGRLVLRLTHDAVLRRTPLLSCHLLQLQRPLLLVL